MALNHQDAAQAQSVTVTGFLEGGNVLRLTNAQGVEKVLVGEYHLYQMLCQLRLEDYFDKRWFRTFC